MCQLQSITKLLDKIKLDNPGEGDMAKALDKQTVQEFCDRYAWTGMGKELVRCAVQAMYVPCSKQCSGCLMHVALCPPSLWPSLTSEPWEVSMLYWLFYIKSGDGIRRLTEVEHGAQERKFKGGSQSICQGMADALGDKVVHLGQPVRSIDWSTARVTVTTRSGDQFRALKVIVALPPTL